ncbi:hypothetical protein GCM10025787_07780 [Saccharopolyspora rosea]
MAGLRRRSRCHGRRGLAAHATSGWAREVTSAAAGSAGRCGAARRTIPTRDGGSDGQLGNITGGAASGPPPPAEPNSRTVNGMNIHVWLARPHPGHQRPEEPVHVGSGRSVPKRVRWLWLRTAALAMFFAGIALCGAPWAYASTPNPNPPNPPPAGGSQSPGNSDSSGNTGSSGNNNTPSNNTPGNNSTPGNNNTTNNNAPGSNNTPNNNVPGNSNGPSNNTPGNNNAPGNVSGNNNTPGNVPGNNNAPNNTPGSNNTSDNNSTPNNNTPNNSNTPNNNTSGNNAPPPGNNTPPPANNTPPSGNNPQPSGNTVTGGISDLVAAGAAAAGGIGGFAATRPRATGKDDDDAAKQATPGGNDPDRPDGAPLDRPLMDAATAKLARAVEDFNQTCEAYGQARRNETLAERAVANADARIEEIQAQWKAANDNVAQNFRTNYIRAQRAGPLNSTSLTMLCSYLLMIASPPAGMAGQVIARLAILGLGATTYTSAADPKTWNEQADKLIQIEYNKIEAEYLEKLKAAWKDAADARAQQANAESSAGDLGVQLVRIRAANHLDLKCRYES